MASIIQTLNGYLWGFPMIAFLFLTHILMSVKTGFVQRKIIKAVKLSVKAPDCAKGDISPFRTLATSLASTLGTGNIVGVGTAVALGGAGAVFWCWLTGVLGMATQYAESLLAVMYRVKSEKGSYSGGTMYVLERGLKSRALGVVYAFLAGVSGLLTGAAIQSNAITEIIKESLHGADRSVFVFQKEVSITGLVTGFVMALLTALVVFGGLGAISKVCSFFVPFMALGYTICCVLILFINREFLYDAVKEILHSAFTLRSASGGVAGGALLLSCRYGVARGLFSNEAGLGTSSVVSASALTPNPVYQGLVAMTATFWDTVVMCLITGLVVVSTMLSDNSINVSQTEVGVLCYKAFSLIPVAGEGLLVGSMVIFAFSTILGWCYTGEKCAGYLLGEKGCKAYRVFWVLAVLIAPVIKFDLVWSMADLCNALLAIPNVYALIALSDKVKKQTALYISDVERT